MTFNTVLGNCCPVLWQIEFQDTHLFQEGVGPFCECFLLDVYPLVPEGTDAARLEVLDISRRHDVLCGLDYSIRPGTSRNDTQLQHSNTEIFQYVQQKAYTIIYTWQKCYRVKFIWCVNINKSTKEKVW